jgi:hypothetical protein
MLTRKRISHEALGQLLDAAATSYVSLPIFHLDILVDFFRRVISSPALRLGGGGGVVFGNLQSN